MVSTVPVTSTVSRYLTSSYVLILCLDSNASSLFSSNHVFFFQKVFVFLQFRLTRQLFFLYFEIYGLFCRKLDCISMRPPHNLCPVVPSFWQCLLPSHKFPVVHCRYSHHTTLHTSPWILAKFNLPCITGLGAQASD